MLEYLKGLIDTYGSASVMNYYEAVNEPVDFMMANKGWTVNYTNYGNLVNSGFGKASDCIACGQCEGVCPQHLPIIENLKKVAAHFEG